MIGDITSRDEQGIIPRVLLQMFEMIETMKRCDETKSAIIRITFLEIYNEDCRDLLQLNDTTSRDIVIRTGKDGNIVTLGARDERVHSYEEAMQLLELGVSNRATAETKLNSSSSRSHSVFTISLDISSPSVSWFEVFFQTATNK